MARSLKKGPYIDENLQKKIQHAPLGTQQVFKTWARDCTITPGMIGFTFGVHNGKDFISVFVKEEMVGHRLGEFSPTTKFTRHGGRIQKELEAKTAQAASETAAAPGTAAPAEKTSAKQQANTKAS